MLDAGGVDLAILDGEATPTGGIGLSRQLKNELPGLPADPAAHRSPRRPVAGPLVPDRRRRAPPDRRASSWPRSPPSCSAGSFQQPRQWRPLPPRRPTDRDPVNVTAWCGRCGESFPLVEVVESGTPGPLPPVRCRLRAGVRSGPGQRRPSGAGRGSRARAVRRPARRRRTRCCTSTAVPWPRSSRARSTTEPCRYQEGSPVTTLRRPGPRCSRPCSRPGPHPRRRRPGRWTR